MPRDRTQSAAAPVEAPVLIVYNPASGQGRGAAFAADLERELSARGVVAERLPTSIDADVFASVDVERFRAIAIVGGDGSFHDAVNGLPRLTRPLAFAGLGTINVLARELNLPASPERLAAAILAGKTLRVPLLRTQDRRFVLFAELGFLGEVVAAVDEWRARHHRHGRSEFIVQSLRIVPFRFGRPLRARFVEADGSSTERAYSNVLLTRARRYAGTLPMPIDPRLATPLGEPDFEVIGYRSATPLGHALILALAGMRLLPRLRGALARLGLLECRRAAHVELSGPPTTRGHLDAESRAGRPDAVRAPLTVTSTDEHLDLIVP